MPISKKLTLWYLENTPLRDSLMSHPSNPPVTSPSKFNSKSSVLHAFFSTGYLPAKQLLNRIAFHDKLSNVARLQGFVEEVEHLFLQVPQELHSPQEHYALEKHIIQTLGNTKELRIQRWKWIKQFITRNVPRKFMNHILYDDSKRDLCLLIAQEPHSNHLDHFLSNLYLVIEEMLPPNLKALGEKNQKSIQQRLEELHTEHDTASVSTAGDTASSYITSPSRKRRSMRKPRKSTYSQSVASTDQNRRLRSPNSVNDFSSNLNSSFQSEEYDNAQHLEEDDPSTPMSTSPVRSTPRQHYGASQNHRSKQHEYPENASFTNSSAAGPVLSTAKTPLDFLIVSLSREFQIDTSQGVALLTSKGDELNDIILDPSNTEYILNWFQEVKANVSHLLSLLQQDLNSISFVMSTLTKGLQSDSSEIAMCVLDILSVIGTHFVVQDSFAQQFWTWFISFQGGLDFILFSLNRHRYKAPRVTETGYSIIFLYSKRHLLELFENHLPKRLDEEDLLVEFCREFVQYILQTHPSSKMILAEQGVLPVIFSFALRVANPTLLKEDMEQQQVSGEGRSSVLSLAASLSTAERTYSAALDLCLFLWREYPLAVEEKKADIIHRIRYAMLKCSASVSMETHQVVFQLLIHLAQLRDKNATLIQKILLESLKRNFKDRVLRAYILKNFGVLLKECPKFPLRKILSLYTKLSQRKNSVESADFELLNRVAKHQFLKWSHASILLDHVSGIALGVHHSQHADAAQATLLLALSRFKTYPEAAQLVRSLIEQFVEQICSSSEDNTPHIEEEHETALQCVRRLLKKNYSQLNAVVLEAIREAHSEHPQNATLSNLLNEWDTIKEEIISSHDSESDADLHEIEMDSEDEAFFEGQSRKPLIPHTPKETSAPPPISVPPTPVVDSAPKKSSRTRRRKPNSSHHKSSSSSILPNIKTRKISSQQSSRVHSRQEKMTTPGFSPASGLLPNIQDKFTHLSPQRRLLARRKAEIERRKKSHQKKVLKQQREEARLKQKEEHVKRKLRRKYEQKLNNRKPLYARPPTGPRVRNGRSPGASRRRKRRSSSTKTPPLPEPQQVSLDIIDSILSKVVVEGKDPISSQYQSPSLLTSPKRVPHRDSHPRSKRTPSTPRGAVSSIKKYTASSPVRRQSLQPPTTTFLSEYSTDQRRIALFCHKIVEDMVKKVESGEAREEIDQKKKAALERKKRHAQWRKKKALFEKRRLEAEEKQKEEAEKESAIKKHHQQIEQEKLDEERERREKEQRKLEARKARNKVLRLKLEAHKKQKKEELQRKREEEEREKARKEAEEKEQKKLRAKERQLAKQKVREYKKRMQEEQRKKEEEEAKKRQAEEEKKQQELQQHKLRKKKLQEEKAKRNNAATTIQRVFRGFLSRKAPPKQVKKRKLRRLSKPHRRTTSSVSSAPNSPQNSTKSASSPRSSRFKSSSPKLRINMDAEHHPSPLTSPQMTESPKIGSSRHGSSDELKENTNASSADNSGREESPSAKDHEAAEKQTTEEVEDAPQGKYTESSETATASQEQTEAQGEEPAAVEEEQQPAEEENNEEPPAAEEEEQQPSSTVEKADSTPTEEEEKSSKLESEATMSDAIQKADPSSPDGTATPSPKEMKNDAPEEAEEDSSASANSASQEDNETETPEADEPESSDAIAEQDKEETPDQNESTQEFIAPDGKREAWVKEESTDASEAQQ